MRRKAILLGVVVALLVMVSFAWRPTASTGAQQDDDPDATVAALQTQVADLETRVAALEEEDQPRSSTDDEDDGANPSNRPTEAAVRQADADAGSRDNPIQIGDSGTVGDYSITILEVVPDAAAQITAENMFNEPPAEGQQFYLVSVEVTYNGSATGNPAFDLNFQAVGESAVAYTVFDNSCGTIPNGQYSANELFPDGTIQFNVCWSIVTSDADSLVMFVESLFEFDAEPLFFSVQPED